jgi:hypothetical protein
MSIDPRAEELAKMESRKEKVSKPYCDTGAI